MNFTISEVYEDAAENRKCFAGCGLTQDSAGVIPYHLLW